MNAERESEGGRLAACPWIIFAPSVDGPLLWPQCNDRIDIAPIVIADRSPRTATILPVRFMSRLVLSENWVVRFRCGRYAAELALCPALGGSVRHGNAPRRRSRSPTGITRLRHSSRIERTNRSACALQLGAWNGVRSPGRLPRRGRARRRPSISDRDRRSVGDHGGAHH
jgi:hypothetical protein